MVAILEVFLYRMSNILWENGQQKLFLSQKKKTRIIEEHYNIRYMYYSFLFRHACTLY